jgi:uncharacterized protein YdeI (YjbR/CyaY-like superfamily)
MVYDNYNFFVIGYGPTERPSDALAPSLRRQYIGWIESAKREETKARRLQEAIRVLAAGKQLGLK